MSLKDYIQIHHRWLIYNLFLGIVMNLILIASTPLGEEWTNLTYFNGLLLVLQISLLVWDFTKVASNFREIEQAIEMEEDLSHIRFKRSNYYTALIERVIEIKDKKYYRGILSYEESADQLEEYTTEWVHELKVKVAICDLILEQVEEGEENAIARLTFPMEQIKFMVNQLLYIIRANHYSKDLNIETIEISELIKSRIKENAPFFIRKNIKIENYLRPHNLISDKKWLQYIVGQVLNNCSKYTPEGGIVSLYMTEDEKALYVHIRDNGIGIPKEELGRVFDKGFTGTNGRRMTRSTGMGLYYAKKMAGELSIGLRVESTKDEYTEVVLSFYKLQDYFKVTKM